MSRGQRTLLASVLLSAAVFAACSGDEATQTGATTTGASASSSSGATTGSSASSTSSTATSASSSTSASSTGAGGSGGASTASAGGAGGAGGLGGGGGTGGAAGGPITAASCFSGLFVNNPMNGPNYDQYNPVIGSHCMGTNHQDIQGVERVVFLGDSITVGTPPSLPSQIYRTLLADSLANKFGLQPANLLWQLVDVINGVALVQTSGDFTSCSKWGARTDDLLPPGNQIGDCFQAADYQKRTLVIITMGGNDISSLTKAAINGTPQADLQTQTQDFVQLMSDAVSWFKTPGLFPNGVFVVFGNMYEFTDGTGDVQACDVSGLAGFDQPIPAPAQLASLVVWANEQYLKIAVDTQTDMIFMLEDFCGHGFHANDPMAPCYRGPNMDTWFDLTCIHPNPVGHQHLADMFMAVVNE